MCFKRLSHGVNEHIIRDENELDRIREYIFNNPLNRHTLESLAKGKGMLGVIFRKSQNKIQDPAKLK